MNSVSNFLGQIVEWLKGLRLWFLVYPWQSALRVRFGNRVRDFGPGVHFKIPWVDRVFIQGTRTCSVLLPQQSITTTDNKIANVTAIVNYRLFDLRRVYETTYSVRDWICSCAMGAVAHYVANMKSTDIQASDIGSSIASSLSDAKDRGVMIEGLSIVGFSVAKAYRLVGDRNGGEWYPVGHGTMIAPNDQFGGGEG